MTTHAAPGPTTHAAPAPTTETSRPARRRFAGSTAIEVFLAVVLFAVALSVRRNFPSDGLFYDDAWQAFGAVSGSFSQIYTVGQSQPLFTLVMMVWARIFGGGATSMVIPALLAGAIGPPALYLVLRKFGQARSTAFLLAAALSAATTDIQFSTRAKSYTTDLLLVLVLVIAVPRFANRRWDTATAVAWVGFTIVVAAVAAVAPLATAAAGITLALHPRSDRNVRVPAVAIQLLAHAIYVIAVSRTYDDKAVRGFWSGGDGFVRFSANPVTFGRTIVEHFVHVTSIFPGGGSHWATVALVVAVAGLGASCYWGTRTIVARFLALTVLIAFGASIVHRVPFGPRPAGGYGRITLWLVPSVAFGLAAALDFARARIAPLRGARMVFDVLTFACAGLVLFTSLGPNHRYPGQGAKRASQSVMARLQPNDAVWITRQMTYSFALSAGTPVRVKPTPNQEVGFLPDFADRRLHVLGFNPSSKELTSSVRTARTVYVVLPPRPSLTAFWNTYAAHLDAALRLLGFAKRHHDRIGSTEVDVWSRRTS